MRALDCPVQPYAWGSRTALAQLQGRPAPTAEPEAELWAGAHHRAPARVAGGGTLLEVIDADPERELGPAVVEQFGPVLPFLLKVLAVDSPLSLQAHPSRAQAEEGHATEERAGVPASAPHRCFADRWPKPELLVALTPFTALCGLRDPAATAALLELLDVPALRPYAELLRSAGAAALPDVLRALLGAQGGDAGLGAAVPELAARLRALAGGGRVAEELAPDVACLDVVARAYPGDAGLLAAALLNVVRLEPGEGIFLPAGNLHAYVSGVGVEVMANSDNVLRGGLTSKHVDVDQLLRILDPAAGPVPVVRPRRVGPEEVYDTPAPEFRLSRVEVDRRGVTLDARGPQVLLCVAGEVAAQADGDAVCLAPGCAAYASAAEPEVTLHGAGTVFRATPGL